MERNKVKSSNIAAVGYELNGNGSGTLEIEFTSGAVYDYMEVPPELAAEFAASESKGKTFAAKIRGRFETLRMPNVEPDPRDQNAQETASEKEPPEGQKQAENAPATDGVAANQQGSDSAPDPKGSGFPF